MASRVVPGISETIARSSPRSALSRLDLPTFGRPTNAIAAGSPSASAAIAASQRRGLGVRAVERRRRPSGSSARRRRPRSTTNGSRRPAATSSAHASASASRALRASSASLSGGSAQTIASSRSPVPRPCDAEIAYVSSQPSEWNSARLELALLVVGLVDDDDDRRRGAAQDARPPRGRPASGRSTASTTKRMTSASAMARRACSWTRASIGSSGSSSRPPVSTMTKRRPFHSVSPYRRSRVVRARSSTIAERWPTNRLNSVLLPTFGRPTMATTGIAAAARWPRQAAPETTPVRRGLSGARSCGRPAWRPVPARRRRARRRWPLASGVPAMSRIRSVDVAQVLDRGRGAAGDADDCRASPKTLGSVRSRTLSIWIAVGPGDLAQPGQLLGVGARATADDDHQVDLAGRLQRVLLAADRDRADGVDDLELVGARRP